MPLSLDSGIVGFYRIDEMRIDLRLAGAHLGSRAPGPCLDNRNAILKAQTLYKTNGWLGVNNDILVVHPRHLAMH